MSQSPDALARGWGRRAGGPPSLVLSFPWRPPSLPRFLPLCLFRACRDGWRSRGSLFRIQGHRALARSLPSEEAFLSLRSCLGVTASLRVGVLSKGDDVPVVVAGAAVASHLLGVQSFRFFGKARNEFALSRRRRGRKEGLGGERLVNCGWEGDRGDQGCEGFHLVFSDRHYRFRNTLQNRRRTGRTLAQSSGVLRQTNCDKAAASTAAASNGSPRVTG